jgi:hypothetical protein
MLYERSISWCFARSSWENLTTFRSEVNAKVSASLRWKNRRDAGR